MKKILLALAIMPLLIVACSSDDDLGKGDFDHNIEYLYGEWRATGVEVSGVMIDLTSPRNELKVTPTYLTFAKEDIYSSEGILGEGTGKFVTNGKIIATTAGKNRVSFEMTSLSSKTAKIIVNAKTLDLAIIPEGTETVIVELTKNYKAVIDFDYDIENLYGKWRATSLEGLPEGSVDLTHPAVEQTYVTFEKKGVYKGEGILGEGTGRYATKGEMVYTLLGEKSLDLEMIALDATTAKIKLNPHDIEFGLPIPSEIKIVTVVLTKQ